MSASEPLEKRAELSVAKRALLAFDDLHERYQALQTRAREPIAVVGTACRLPGGVQDVDGLWRLLASHRTAETTVPVERWDADAFYHADPARRGAIVTRKGHFLESVDEFDHEFFGFSPREAERMDPQHRLVLELVWEALQDAGMPPSRLPREKTGVFVGIMSAEYGKMIASSGAAAFDTYYLTGNLPSFAAGRVAYALGTRGPCMAIDSACSSSLVAVHQACKSLRLGETDLGLVAGVSLVLTPELTIGLSNSRVIAPDGLCKTFSADADGIGRGEGAAALVLKRLSDAKRDRDEIFLVIRGTAVNHDGPSAGLTVPSGEAQQQLLRTALHESDLEPAAIDYHEAHGTGTPLGDQIELRAIGSALGKGRSKGHLYVGSIKANIGHLDAAAGIVGLLKAGVVARKGIVPGQPTLGEPSSQIDWERAGLAVSAQDVVLRGALDGGERGPLRASVASFGLSGTNAAAVVEGFRSVEEEAPSDELLPRSNTASAEPELVVVSANSPEANRDLARSLADRFEALEGAVLGQAVAACNFRRERYSHRLAVVGADGGSIAQALRTVAAGKRHRLGSAGTASRRRAEAPVAFLFPGAGAQSPGMGRGLWEREASFRATLRELDALLAPRLGWSPADVLRGASEVPLSHDYVQPLMFAFQLGLAALWRARGIVPTAVVGHSAGEVAAACVAGVLSTEMACNLICERTRATGRVRGAGVVAIVELSGQEVTALLADKYPDLDLAGKNSPTSTLVSGPKPVIEALLADVGSRGVYGRTVKIEFPSHSRYVEPIREAFISRIENLRHQPPKMRFVSTVLGRVAEVAELNAEYWYRNVREPVDLLGAVTILQDSGCEAFVELSPGPVLLHDVRTTTQARATGDQQPLAVATVHGRHGEVASWLHAVGTMHVHGFPARLASEEPSSVRQVSLPKHPWRRERHWVSPVRRHADYASAPRKEPLLSRKVQCSVVESHDVWEMDLDAGAWSPDDHQVNGVAIVPGTALIEGVAEALAQHHSAPCELRDLDFVEALRLEQGSHRELQVAVQRGTELTFQVASCRDEGMWTVHLSGRAEAFGPKTDAAMAAPYPMPGRPAQPVPVDEFYRKLDKAGLGYGRDFRLLDELYHSADEVVAKLRVPDGNNQEFRCDPVVLDAALHASLALDAESLGTAAPFVPSSIERLVLGSRPQGPLFSHVRRRPEASSGERILDITVFEETGARVVEVSGLLLRRMPAGRAPFLEAPSMGWVPVDMGGALRSDPGACTVEVAGGESALVLAEALTEAGGRVTRREVSEVIDSPEALAAIEHLVLVLPARWSSRSPMPHVHEACGQLMEVVQALDRSGCSPRLWVVTEGVSRLRDGGAPHALPYAAMSGFCRAAMYEHPELRCTWLDVEDLQQSVAVGRTAQVVLQDLRETELTVDDSEVRAARLQRPGAPETQDASAPVVRSDATYLISGGLGGLGLAAAQWLADKGARHLLLLGRSGVRDEAQATAIARLAKLGCSVTVARVDVADEAGLAQCLAGLEGGPPLRGIIHAAGILDDGPISSQTHASLHRVLSPKVAGAWNLHEQTGELDFFVLYSSVSSLLGAPGQSNYAAANAFMDALAWHRRALGMPALSVNWGPFRDVGMVPADAARLQNLERTGLKGMHSMEAGPALEAMWSGAVAQRTLALLDIQAWLDAHPVFKESSLVRDYLDDSVEGTRAPQRTVQLESLSSPERVGAIQAVLMEELGYVLHVQAERLDPATAPKDHGVDSLMAIELKNRLHRVLGMRLPVATFLENKAIEVIAQDVARLWETTQLMVALQGPTSADGEEWEVTSE